MAEGSYLVGPQSGRLLVKTTRTGLGAKAGHDLTIEVTRWHGNVLIDAASLASSSVTVEADVGSFEVREGTGGVKPLTDTDRADIKNTLRGKILNTRQHPVITFVSSKVSGTAESFHIDGDLTIVGVTQPVTVEGQLTAGKPHRTATYRERSPSQACVSSGRAFRRKGALHTRIARPPPHTDAALAGRRNSRDGTTAGRPPGQAI